MINREKLSQLRRNWFNLLVITILLTQCAVLGKEKSLPDEIGGMLAVACIEGIGSNIPDGECGSDDVIANISSLTITQADGEIVELDPTTRGQEGDFYDLRDPLYRHADDYLVNFHVDQVKRELGIDVCGEIKDGGRREIDDPTTTIQGDMITVQVWEAILSTAKCNSVTG